MKKTSLQSIYAIILKELRHDRSYNQKKLSINLNLSQSSITKIETGINAITLENLIKFSYFFHENPGSIIAASERYAMWLESFFDYEIFIEKIPLQEDDFLKLANEFYKSEIFKKVFPFDNDFNVFSNRVLSFPKPSQSLNKITPQLLLKSVFHYITNESYRSGKIVPGYSRYNYIVEYKEINNLNEVLSFFSDENINDNRNAFIDRLRKKAFLHTNPFANYD